MRWLPAYMLLVCTCEQYILHELYCVRHGTVRTIFLKILKLLAVAGRAHCSPLPHLSRGRQSTVLATGASCFGEPALVHPLLVAGAS